MSFPYLRVQALRAPHSFHGFCPQLYMEYPHRYMDYKLRIPRRFSQFNGSGAQMEVS